MIETRAACGTASENLVVEYSGGGVADAAIYVQDADVTLIDVAIRDCEGAGLGMWRDSALGAASDRVSIENCDEAAFMVPDAVGAFADMDVSLTGNAADRLRVTAPGSRRPSITRPATWRHLGVDYCVEEGIHVEGTAETPASLTLEAGTTLRFGGGKFITVGSEGAGTLTIQGTEASPVRLLPWTANLAGEWRGVQFLGATLGEDVLEHVEIEYAGGGTNRGTVDVRSGAVTLREVTVRHSESCGLYDDTTDTTVTVDGLVVEDSAGDTCTP